MFKGAKTVNTSINGERANLLVVDHVPLGENSCMAAALKLKSHDQVLEHWELMRDCMIMGAQSVHEGEEETRVWH